MVFNVIAPQFGSDSVKDNIISILSEDKELNAKEIHSRISKIREVSYQAVFKTLKQLCEENILNKKGTKYEINEVWIENIKKFANRIEQRNKFKTPKNFGESHTMEFETLYSFFEGMLDLFSSDILFKNCTHQFGGGILRHLWWPLSFGDKYFQKFKYMGTAHDSYIIVTEDTNVDRWLKPYYEKTGFKGIKLSTKYKLEDDIATVGDYVFQIFFEEQMKNRIDTLYSNAQDMGDAIKDDIIEEILSKKTRVRVIVTKNPELAKIYRDKIMSYF